MPQQVAMRVAFPEELGDPKELAAALEATVKRIEEGAAEERRRNGRRIVGRAVVLKQAWNDAPTTFEARRVLSPRVAAGNRWARIEALARNKEFVRAYAIARSLWRDGANALFPPGTYWLRRFAHVAIAEL